MHSTFPHRSSPHRLNPRAHLHGRSTARIAALATCCAVFTLGAPCHASAVRALSLAELTRISDAVVVGTVGEVETRRGEDGRLFREAAVRVERNVLGEEGATVVVRLLGGSEGDVAQTVPGEAELAFGQRVLLFLEKRRPRKGPARFVVAGLSQGRFGIVEGARTKTLFAVRELRASGIVGEVDDAPFGIGAVDTSTFVPLDALIAAVRELSRGRR